MYEATKIVAWTSVALYTTMCAISSYYFFKYQMMPKDVDLLDSTLTSTAIATKLFSERCKKYFFLILALSAASDVPFYSACIQLDFPRACIWNGRVHDILWSFHLFSIWGYTIVLGIPLYLWSELVHGGDGNIVTTRILALSIGIYTVFMIITILGNDLNSEYLYNQLVSTYLESISMCCIALSWLIIGIRLQLHVVEVKFGQDNERRILFLVNVVLFTVTVSFLLRAILIGLRNAGIVVEGVNFNYILWALLTRWVPHVFCSYLMMYIFQKSEYTVRKQKFGDAYGPRRRSRMPLSRESNTTGSGSEGRGGSRLASKSVFGSAHYSLASSGEVLDNEIRLPLFGEPKPLQFEDDSDDFAGPGQKDHFNEFVGFLKRQSEI